MDEMSDYERLRERNIAERKSFFEATFGGQKEVDAAKKLIVTGLKDDPTTSSKANIANVPCGSLGPNANSCASAPLQGQLRVCVYTVPICILRLHRKKCTCAQGCLGARQPHARR